MHSSRMRTTHSSTDIGGGGCPHTLSPGAGTPTPPPEQTHPSGPDPLGPGTPLGLGTPGDRIPPLGAGTPSPPWTETLTHATENITLPQTSFAGGNKVTQAQSNFTVLTEVLLVFSFQELISRPFGLWLSCLCVVLATLETFVTEIYVIPSVIKNASCITFITQQTHIYVIYNRIYE